MRRKSLTLPFVAMLLVVLVACSTTPQAAQSPTETTTESTASESTASQTAEPFGKYDPPIEIHFVRSVDDTIETNVLANYSNQTIEDNFWLDTYEEELGIKVVYDWIVKGGDEYTQKMNVTLASGDIPDVMEVTSSQLAQLAEAGLIQDLGSLYEQYGTDFTKETMSEDGDAPFLAGQVDGVQYGLPVTYGTIDSVDLMWLRSDWLEKLGLSAPTTMDEFMSVVDAFTNADLDGNGKKDTVGLAIAGTDLWGGYAGLRGFFNTYGAYPGMWIEKDGQLAYGSLQPEVKTALGKLAEMYQKGYIDPEFGVKDGGKTAESAAAGLNGVSFGQQWNSVWPLQACHENFADCQWSAYPIPSSSDTPSKTQATMGTTTWYVVNKNFEHPEALVKMINLFIEKCWGETGDNGKYYAPPEAEGVWKLSPITTSRINKNLDAYRDLEEARQSGDTSKLTGEALSIQKKLDSYYSGSDEGFALWGWERAYGPAPSSFSSIDSLVKDDRILVDKFLGAPTPTMVEKMSTLKKMQDEVFTKIILGEAPLDEFDKFVADFNQLGGTTITEEVNAWYSTVK